MSAALASCGGNKASKEAAKEADADVAAVDSVETLSLDGEWRLADYVGPEGFVAVPDTLDYTLTFNQSDSTFNMTTDCNSLFGQYTLPEDSIRFENIGATQMLCPQANVEQAMAEILPRISTYSISSDSVLSLRSDARIMARFKK